MIHQLEYGGELAAELPEHVDPWCLFLDLQIHNSARAKCCQRVVTNSGLARPDQEGSLDPTALEQALRGTAVEVGKPSGVECGRRLGRGKVLSP